MFKLFCTDEFNTYLIRMVNSFVIEAVNVGKRVLIISPFSNAIVRNFLKAVGRKNNQNNLFWFDDKKLYFCECMPDDSDILFFIDTSGSISDNDMTAAYSEIKGAIDQYDGKLQGWLGFFDAAIIEPKPFSSFEEFNVIKPAGGGGTDFQIIFEYVNQHMKEKEPN